MVAPSSGRNDKEGVLREYSLVVERLLAKQQIRVRFPVPAPKSIEKMSFMGIIGQNLTFSKINSFINGHKLSYF